MSNPFQRYENIVNDLASTWPVVHPRTAAPTSEQVRYNAVSDVIVDTIASSQPQLPDKLTSSSVRHSQKVMLRYCLMAARIAKQDSLSMDELITTLNDPRSFGMLATLASHQVRVASYTESDYGIRHHSYPIEQYYLDQFTVTNGYMEPKDLSETIALNKVLVRDAGHQIYEGQCPAHRSGALEPIYSSMIQICARDNNLFVRTLTDNT